MADPIVSQVFTFPGGRQANIRVKRLGYGEPYERPVLMSATWSDSGEKLSHEDNEHIRANLL